MFYPLEETLCECIGFARFRSELELLLETELSSMVNLRLPLQILYKIVTKARTVKTFAKALFLSGKVCLFMFHKRRLTVGESTPNLNSLFSVNNTKVLYIIGTTYSTTSYKQSVMLSNHTTAIASSAYSCYTEFWCPWTYSVLL